ncbi:acyltransferase family protein [Microbacterium indicum]|uniref:acyltransferase family protein n=1 Tax=Microbacterium indicum TaxID=358100 RepID=UPI0004120C95|nr:acyltransferase [Microbacterium indicum]
MTLLRTPLSVAPAPPARRDRSIDLLRAACIVVVVLLHATMAGIAVADGAPVIRNALDEPWFAPVSWVLQIMPLFFLAGGVTGLGAWRRAAARGERAAAFAASRVVRLIRPAVAAFAAIGAALAVLSIAGVPADLVAEAGFRISQPMWFLGVFVLVQALVPLAARAHDREPAASAVALVVAVAAIDATRYVTGADAVGMLGLAAVWLAVQQAGFWLADGAFDRITPRARLVAAGALLLALGVMTGLGPYPADMYVGLNPPTLALVVLGVAQALVFSVGQPAMRRWADLPALRGIVDRLGTLSMTIYLWHMPVVIALAGAGLALGLAGAVDLPEIHSAAWWLGRPAWLALALVATLIVASRAARFDRGGAASPGIRSGRAAAAVAAGVIAVALPLVAGLGWLTAALSAGLAAAAVALAGDSPRPRLRGDRMAHKNPTEQDGIVTIDSERRIPWRF